MYLEILFLFFNYFFQAVTLGESFLICQYQFDIFFVYVIVYCSSQ